jgi:hypothetical protein
LEQYQFSLNIINYYGEQEGRTSKDEVLQRWIRFRKDLDDIKARGEPSIIIGDFNKHIGNDNLGVSGNNGDISYGGTLVRDLLSTGDYLLINNTEKSVGGPFTRFDPANKTRKSCLELVIVSASLEPFVKELLIDSAGKFPMQRVVSRKGKLVYIPTDHYTLILTLSNLQEERTIKSKQMVWNTMKPNGWEKYEKLNNEKAEEFDEVIKDNEIPIEKVVEDVEKMLNRIKYSAFGKTTVRKKSLPKHTGDLKPVELLEQQ